MKHLLILATMLAPFTLVAKPGGDGSVVAEPPAVIEQDPRTDPNFVYTVVEQMPEFPDREPAMFKYLAESFQYPESAAEEEIQGKVFVQFIVERDGSITEVKVLRGVHPLLDREVVRVIKSMPAWKPGKQNGEPVRVRYNLPFNCVLPK
jgi:protein TonB